MSVRELTDERLEEHYRGSVAHASRRPRVSANRVLPGRGKRLAPCTSSLERKIHRTFTNWSCAMTNASVNSDHMPRQELDSAIVKINEEAAFQCQKTLIGVGVTVPMISLSHSAYTNFMIVDLSNWMVIVALRRC